MTIFIAVEEFAGQHSDLQKPSGRRIPFCKCDGPQERGSDSCLRCGRYKRGHFRPGSVFPDYTQKGWEALMRQRPHAESEAA